MAKSHINIPMNNIPIVIKVETGACPFFIKKSNNTIIKIVKNNCTILWMESLFFSLYFKCRFPIMKGKIMIPQTILTSKCKPNKKDGKHFEKVYPDGAKW